MDQRQCWLSRRDFLRASGAVALLAAHHGVAQERSTSQGTPSAGANGHKDPRILSLELLTAAPLTRMKEFYHQALGLAVLADKPDRLTLAAGLTQLTFVPAPADAGQPFYHFAFNIPENKILTALEWQNAKSPLIPVPESLQDAAYPKEVVNYSHWNAHSIFFFDPAQNVVEYIARHDLASAQTGSFSSRDILYASEIAFVVDDVPTAASTIGQAAGVKLYRGGSDAFTALGDEHGLLLIMKRGRLISLASPQKKEVAVYRTKASVRGTKRILHSIPGFPYEVRVEV